MSAPRLALVLGDQLSFELASLRELNPERDAILMAEVVEEATYVPHHPQKIALIFSAMRHFAEALRQRGWRVLYSRLDDPHNSGSIVGELRRGLEQLGAGAIHLTECGEWRLQQALCDSGLPLVWHADRRFFCSREWFAGWAHGKRQLRMEFFYREMRRKHGVLMNADGTPVGGAWNFDAENRKALPRHTKAPAAAGFAADAMTREVLRLVGERFSAHYGSLAGFDYPVTHAEAEQLWRHFLDFALPAFGDYQDAMASGEPYLFHARISAALNIGLLDVRRLCADVESAYWAGRVPLNAAEGFIRQLLGWREYVRGIYWARMPAYAEANALGHARPLPGWFWTGKTRMRCLAESIGQSLEEAYAHHIQRLMVIGNFALLAGLAPAEVHRWYLGVYIDAFEWVELPNTLGMSQFADGGLLATKPYVSSAAYVDRMGDYCKGCHYDKKARSGDHACPFNALYWDFFDRQRERLGNNHRLGMVYRQLDKMEGGTLDALRAQAARLRERMEAL